MNRTTAFLPLLLIYIYIIRECGEAITKVTKAAKCSVVTSYCGHGIGTLFHTAPNVPHYANNKAKGTMQVGHVFTIEPMINAGGSRDVLWPDGWTAVSIMCSCECYILSYFSKLTS